MMMNMMITSMMVMMTDPVAYSGSSTPPFRSPLNWSPTGVGGAGYRVDHTSRTSSLPSKAISWWYWGPAGYPFSSSLQRYIMMISILSPFKSYIMVIILMYIRASCVSFQLWLPKLYNDNDQLAAAGYNTPHPDILAGLKSFVIVLILTIR